VEPVIHNLDTVAEWLDGAVRRREDMTAQCPLCQATNTQSENICSGCGSPVIWKHSRHWRMTYGNADRYIRRLRGDLKPITPMQARIAMKFNGEPEFRTLTEKKTVIAIERSRPDEFVMELLEWAGDKGFQAFEDACKKEDLYTKWLQRNMEMVADGGMPGDELY